MKKSKEIYVIWICFVILFLNAGLCFGGDSSTSHNAHVSALYFDSNAIDLFVDKSGKDGNQCTQTAKCLTLNRALSLAPSLVKASAPSMTRGSINIHIGRGTYRESIRLISSPLAYGTSIAFIGTFDPFTGEPTTIIDNENKRDYAFDIQNGVQAILQDIEIANIKDGKVGISAVNHVKLSLYNIYFRVAHPANTHTICVVANAHSHIYSKRSNVEGCDLGIEAVNSGVIHAGYSSVIVGTHSGRSGSSRLIDASQRWAPGRLVGAKINNRTDGSTCKIISNTANSAECTLAGGANNSWNNGDDYAIYDGSDTYKNNTWAGLYYAENSSGHVDNSYFVGNNRGVELQYESRANFEGNTFRNNKAAIAALHNSTIFDSLGNTFAENAVNYDLKTGSTYGDLNGISHTVPCVVSADCSAQTGAGYCCWESTTNKLFFGNGDRAVEVGK